MQQDYESRYEAVPTRMWRMPEVRALTRDQKLILIYLRTAPEQTSLGCFVLSIPAMAEEFGLSVRAARGIVQHLTDVKLIVFDEKTRLVYVRGHFDCNPIRNPNIVTGALKMLREMPRSLVLLEVARDLQAFNRSCLRELIQELQAMAGAYLPGQEPLILPGMPAEPSGELFCEPLGKPFPEPLPEQSGKQIGKQIGKSVPVPVSVSVPPSPDPPAQAAGEGGGGGFRPRVGSGKGKLLSELTRKELDWYATRCQLPDHQAAASRHLRQLDERTKAPPDTQPPEERYQAVLEAQEEMPQPGTPEYAERVRQIKRSMMAAPAAISGVIAQVMAAGGDDEDP